MLEFRKDLFAAERDDIHIDGQRRPAEGTCPAMSPAGPPFFDDHAFEGLLHLKVVRSPHHHARIRSIDVSAAERAPGVKRILRGR